MTPSQAARGAKAGRERPPGERYTTASYRRAIHRACRAAKVEPWSPNQLRHAAATMLRKRHGIEVARIILGHTNLVTTQFYAEADMRKAVEMGGRLDCGWKIRYNRGLRCIQSDFVVIRSRRALMSRLSLTPDQAELSDRIYQSLRQAADADLRSLADLLASKPDRLLLGQTEFEVRDRVHTIGAKAFEAALNQRKKGATEARR